MDLHKGETFWHQTGKEADYLTMIKDEQAEVVIIGAGMTGALIAYELLKDHYDVVLLDKGVPGYGSSDGNTGIIQYNSDNSLNEMIVEHGEQRAVDFYRMSVEGIKLLHQIANELKEDVGYAPKNSLYLCAKEEQEPGLQKIFATLKKYGFPAELLNREELMQEYSLHAFGAMKTPLDLELNPFKWIQAVHRSNLARGARVYKNVEAIDVISDDQGRYIVQTKNGLRVTTKFVIYAIGYAENIIPEVEPLVERNSTFSVVTEKTDVFWGERALVWDTAEPYLYFHSTDDGRVIAGGRDKEGMKFSSQEKINQENEKILARIKVYFPAFSANPYTMWQSIFGISKDGIPFIDKRKIEENQYIALGYGGNGTCYAAIAAILLRSYLKGEVHPYAYTVALKGRL